MVHEKFLMVLACTLAGIMYTSCSNDCPEDVINPFSIYMNTEARAEKDGSYLVNPDGGIFKFNIYRGEPWLSSVKEQVFDKSILTYTEWGRRDSLRTSWVYARILNDEGISKKLDISIMPTTSKEMRYIYITISNSMKTKTIIFKQLGMFNAND